MSAERDYDVLCQEEGKWIRTQASATPTECPVNNAHTVLGVRELDLRPGPVNTIPVSDGTTISYQPMIGSYFQSVENKIQRSTSSTVWQRAQRITTGNVPQGTYRIEANGMWRFTSNNNSARFRIIINGIDTILGNEYMTLQPRHTGQSQRLPLSFSDYYTGSGVMNIDLEYSRDGRSGTVELYWTRLTIWRVA